MSFDINILFETNGARSNEEVSRVIYPYLDSLIPEQYKEYRLLNNLSDPSAIHLEWLKKKKNPFLIPMSNFFWRVNHTIDFYQGLINVLQKNKFSVKEIFMNFEDCGSFFNKYPLRILSEKLLNPFGNNKSYFYYMSQEEFKSQSTFRTRLIFCYFFSDAQIENNTNVFANPDRYVVSKVEGGYFVEAKTINALIGSIGYFRYIKQKDIDSRVITEIERTGEYVVKKDGDWWFIYKKGIDDLI